MHTYLMDKDNNSNTHTVITYFQFQAINDVVKDMDWETFTLIYESPESLINLQEVLKEKMGRSPYDRPIVVMKELPEYVEDYKLARNYSNNV